MNPVVRDQGARITSMRLKKLRASVEWGKDQILVGEGASDKQVNLVNNERFLYIVRP